MRQINARDNHIFPDQRVQFEQQALDQMNDLGALQILYLERKRELAQLEKERQLEHQSFVM